MDYDYLNDERKKLWLKIADLEKQIKEKSSDIELEIRQHAENVRMYTAQIETDKNIISARNTEADNASRLIQDQSIKVSEIFSNITSQYNEIEALKNQAALIVPELTSLRSNAQTMFNEMQAVYINNPDLQAKSIEFNDRYNSSNEILSRINATYQSIVTRKNEIDETYYSILGHTNKEEETGKEIKVKGLKDELNETFNKLKAEFASHQVFVEAENNKFIERISNFEGIKTQEFKEKLESWNNEYDKVKNKINELLPKALTTGLSYAFSEKKEQELSESKEHAKKFFYSILVMILISFIPLAVSVHSLFNDVPLNEAILRLPRLVLAIIPLYIPVLWFAYSSNRKGNLSKRLIEEYSHKEVLSKTYEGLSTQIDGLGEKCNNFDLKEKLLFNILAVSAENPGKLISDYNKSDHPLMDALDKSVKLANSIELLTRLPGFSKLANMLSVKRENILAEQTAKAENGLKASTED